MNYLKRDDAVFAACRVLDKFGGCKMGPLCPDVGCSEVRDIVDEYICQNVVEQKYATWVLKTFDDGYGSYQLYECDHCGGLTAQRRKYCADCGALMQ